MVGEAHGPRRYIPGIVPLKPLIVHESPHELGYHQSGMSIVRLYGYVIGEVCPRLIRVTLFIGPEDRLNACAYQEILLFESQYLARFRIVIGIKYRSKCLCFALGPHRF